MQNWAPDFQSARQARIDGGQGSVAQPAPDTDWKALVTASMT